MKTVLGLLAFASVSFAAGLGLAEHSPEGRILVAATQPTADSPSAMGHAPVSAGLQHKKTIRKASDSAEVILRFAHRFMGLEYKYGGNSPAGFDCSGFTHYVYSKFGYQVPHGSVNQAEVGQAIDQNQARRGDLLIFTGTNLSDRTPGHVGIVISRRGEPLRFIHSSSNGGVKISEVKGTRYAQRLLEVRRIL